MTALPDLLSRYLSDRWGKATAVTGLRRFHGGAARETYRFDAFIEGEPPRGLVLRRDPPSSLIETDRRTEFEALRIFQGSRVPVPEILFVEAGSQAFGSPGFIMAEVPEVRAAGLFETEPYGDARSAVGRQMFTILGHIHAHDPGALAGIMEKPAAGDAWRTRLDHWKATIDADALGPEPIVRAAIRWLERNPPPPPERVAIVHGDYRSGNFLVDERNDIKAVVDWEMVHLGDPLEDLAWACDPLWAHGSDRPGSTLPLADCIAAWEASSGLTCDPAALRWWRVFAQVIGLAIWISSAREVASGRTTNPINIFAALYTYRFHNRTLAHQLKELAA